MPSPDLVQAAWFFGFLAFATLTLGAAALFMLRRRTGPGFHRKSELGCIALVLAAALASLGPDMARTSAVGAGDAYHYALQAADFVTQLRAGVFPVLVGQSYYGFNGNIHTLRTAPYYTHFCGLVDLATWHHLSAFALQNLVALLTALGGGLSAYLAGRVLLPGSRVGPALLASLYITAPGVVGTLLGGDMYAAFMAVPWLPLAILGAMQCVTRADPRGPLALLTGALALTWLAHPPTGILLTPMMVLAVLWRTWRGPGRGRFLTDAVCAAAGFFGLTGYLFYSVSSMQLGYLGKEIENAAPVLISQLPGLWPALLQPITAQGHKVTDLQPGYAAMFLAGAMLALLRRDKWTGWFLVVALAGYALICMPTFFAGWVWQSLSPQLINVIQPWPHQRIIPIITALVVLGCNASAPWILARGPRCKICCVALLAAGLLWNLSELQKFDVHARGLPVMAAATELPLPAANEVLTRSSYLLFREFPEYYSHGYMEPAAETRLLDDGLQLLLTNTADILQHIPPQAGGWQDLARPARFPLKPGKGCVLEFKFAQPDAPGEVTVASGTMTRYFTLPLSGERLAFGSRPDADHTLLIRADALDGRLLVVHSLAPGVAVRLYFYDETALPLRVTSLIPFTVQLQAKQAGWLESPRVFLPGYHATVNDRETPVSRSPEGLVMVPTPAGDSIVKIDYPGPPGLRVTFFISLLALLGWPIATIAFYRAPAASEVAPKKIRVPTVIAAASVALTMGVVSFRAFQATRGNTWRLVVDLPRVPKAPTEPLLVLGTTGAADVIYIHYADPHSITINYDHWRFGGPQSPPVRCVPGQRLTIDLTLPELGNGAMSGAESGQTTPAPVRIAVDGRELLKATLPWYRVPAGTITVGLNQIGASSCAERFSGHVIESGRVTLPASE